MSRINRYGLSSDIPDPIRRSVRQRDGFGCVRCGRAIYDYEHLDPPFADAREHRTEGIVLLCVSCHGKKTRGFLSPETIRAAAADPRCKQKGFSFEEFDIGTEYPQIGIGMAIFKKVDSLIEIYGQSILSISPPLQAGLPFRINAFMTDTHGMTILEIIDNEWRAAAANWDVEVGGGRTAIRRGPGDIALRLRIISPGALVIDRIDMQHLGVRVRSRDGGALYVENAGTSLSFKHVTLYDMLVGLYVTKHGVGCGRGRTPPRRNSRCYCFSGLRYKECCGAYVSRPG